jgi:hypothetical protein
MTRNRHPFLAVGPIVVVALAAALVAWLVRGATVPSEQEDSFRQVQTLRHAFTNKRSEESRKDTFPTPASCAHALVKGRRRRQEVWGVQVECS